MSVCEKHGNELSDFPCWDCQREWRERNPKTAAAIARLAQGKSANVVAARAQDAAEHPPT